MQRLRDLLERVQREGAEQRAHFRRLERGAAAGDGLVQRRKRVAHAALARLRQHGERLRVGLDAFLPADPLHPGHHLVEIHRAETEVLAARGDGGGDLVRLGRAQHEDHPLGRLLERLQQRVEGLAGDLVRFVDDEDLVAVARRPVAHVLPQLAHLVDAAIGGGVDLDHVGRVRRRRSPGSSRTRRRAWPWGPGRSSGSAPGCAPPWSCPCPAGPRRCSRARSGSARWRFPAWSGRAPGSTSSEKVCGRYFRAMTWYMNGGLRLDSPGPG